MINKIDQKINDILDNFCQNSGEIKVDNNFHELYRQNKVIFYQMIDDYKLITKNVGGKIILTSLGVEVCENGGWINWKKREEGKQNGIWGRIKNFSQQFWKLILGIITILTLIGLLIDNRDRLIKYLETKKPNIEQSHNE